MSVKDLSEFLKHEQKHFLQPTRRAAMDNARAWGPGSVEQVMWQGWAQYYQVLIEENRAMQRWTKQDYEDTLPELIAALRELEAKVVSHLNRLGPDDPARAPLANFAELMRIERVGKALMLEEARS